MPINIVVPNILKGIPNKFNNANKTPAVTNNIAFTIIPLTKVPKHTYSIKTSQYLQRAIFIIVAP